ncbi:MAG TPA: cupin domain-containing protein [Sphingopyxis sp.]|uniref:cupin domain-containing protein n=1 Tax=Sphingopyxis sp. TaxID=1908224 RepID=UPI002CE57605|nr:cupin domain-containing protein [Sphingopyxis sp.]HWW58801.1 cupin domain-containing protein [Sphingopyxis sp.]
MTDQPTKFRIFRAATAPTLKQSNVLRYEGVTPVIAEGLQELGKAGIGDGSFAKILFNAPGFSLAYAWHKSDFPLPLHSHDSDCCYLVLAGEMRFGKEVLGKGDGVFVPADTPYTFVTGPDGVEFIEFRNVTSWNIIFKSGNPASWTKGAERVAALRDAWQTEKQPVGFVEPVE